MSEHEVQSILFKYSNLFIVSKLIGIYPYNLQIFLKYRQLKESAIGTMYTIFAMVVIIVLYNLLIFSLWEDENPLKISQSNLTLVIGIFLSYIGLLVMATDVFNSLFNQKKLGDLYERIRIADERLLSEGCWIDNTKLSKHITILLMVVFGCEIAIIIMIYIMLLDHSKWKSLLWVFSCFPTLYNSLDKIWFVATIRAMQDRFYAINVALSKIVEEHERYVNKTVYSGNEKEDNLNFLYEELSGAATKSMARFKKDNNRIIPVAPNLKENEGFSVKRNNEKNNTRESLLSNVIKADDKLNRLCQLHDELCEIGVTLNELWSYPILVLMIYSFIIFTSQLYFLYCATQEQNIPSLFLSAKSTLITAVYLGYVSGKCIYLVYVSWKTSLESKFTGICLHKCAIVADNNDIYDIINNLSLKLLNHSVNFSACGFFSLSMETLYDVSGGITSYLIILIQFNLVAQQLKEAFNNRPQRGRNMDSHQHTTTMMTNLISSTISTAFTTE